MKLKLFLLVFLLVPVVFFCQDKQNTHGEVPPYTVVGNRTMNLSSNYFTSDMKGSAQIALRMGRKCDIINFAIISISVYDQEKKNQLTYADSNIFNILAEKRYDIFKKDYYPIYIQPLYDLLRYFINKLKIEYSSDTKDLKDINELGFIIKIE